MRACRQLFGIAEFRALFATQCLSMAAASIASLALATITYSATRNAVLSGLAMFGGPLIRLTLPWIAMSATGGSMLALVSDILPAGSYVFGRATLNIAVGGTQIVAYAVGGILLLYLHTPARFLSAAAASALALVLVIKGVGDHPPRSAGQPLMRRARTINRTLPGSPLLRPVYLAAWIPNGLIVGCESLFVPFAGHAAGYLFAATAAGMLTGDILVGRFLPAQARTGLIEPLRFLLAALYVLFFLHPPLGAAAALGFLASAGYAASLPLQERLISHTSPEVRGQVLGLNSTGLTAMQGVGAVIAGLLTEQLHGGPAAACTAIGVMGCASLAVTVILIPGLRRTRSQPNGPGHEARAGARLGGG